jgi:hypothetical protein
MGAIALALQFLEQPFDASIAAGSREDPVSCSAESFP